MPRHCRDCGEGGGFFEDDSEGGPVRDQIIPRAPVATKPPPTPGGFAGLPVVLPPPTPPPTPAFAPPRFVPTVITEPVRKPVPDVRASLPVVLPPPGPAFQELNIPTVTLEGSANAPDLPTMGPAAPRVLPCC